MTTTKIHLRRVDATELRRSPREPVPGEILDQAQEIVAAVRSGGETVLRRYAMRFDGLGPESLLVLGPERMRAAFEALPVRERDVLERTADRIRRFARAQRSALSDVSIVAHGMRMGHRVLPVPTAGCYAPGGRFPLPSTVLMTVCTAREAGVAEVLVASPNPQPVTLAAAHVAGADAVLAAGGAHAIAAMAFGTESVPACSVIVGPGNAWVTAGKQLVAGRVRIDSLAGPSELLVVADHTTDPALVAADLLAQAEHDVMAIPSLLALDEGVIEAVEAELSAQLTRLPTAETASVALHNGFAVRVHDLEEAIELCDLLAPEHLQWMVGQTTLARERLRHYGGLFLGQGAAEVLGDYGAGPNHVLPTGGSARSKGGLSVFDFVKVNTWMEVEDAPATRVLCEDAAQLAALEGLAGHEQAARRRWTPGVGNP